MAAFLDLPLKRKQTLLVMATSTAALLLASTGFIYFDNISFRKNLVSNLTLLADINQNNAVAALEFDDPSEAQNILDSFHNKRALVSAALYNRLGVLAASYPTNSPAPSRVLPPPDGTEITWGDNALVVIRALRDRDGGVFGSMYLKSNLNELSARWKTYGLVVLGVLIASLLLAYILTSRLQRLISDPILGLARAAQDISQHKNYDLRVPSRGRDEIGQLTNAFNEMLAQIQERDAALQRAHDGLELRVSERTRELQQEVLDRKKAEQALQQQLQRTSLLNSITRAIISRHDFESISLVLLGELETHLCAEFSALCLIDPRTAQITWVATRGRATSEESLAGFFKKGDSASGLNLPLDLGKPLASWAPTSAVAHPLAQAFHQNGFNSAVLAPLLVEQDLYGWLLAARASLEPFSEHDAEFLRMLSQEVALAAQQFRLHSELQKAYNDLRQTQAAVMQQERLRALGQMASGIAHDVNNALTPIVTYADLVLRAEPNLSASSTKNLQIIKTAGEDIAHIVSRMREFYRKRDENDAVSLVQLNALAAQVIDLTRPRWRDIPQAHGVVIQMRTEFQPRMPDVLGNESELRESVTNLILNAVDAMPQGGTLTLRTGARPADPAGDPAAIKAVLEVCDTGHGMDEETAKRCLEPFFSTKGKRGTGLGLAMVYGVMERHNGAIEIDTRPGEGATMRLVFPAAAPFLPRQTSVPAPLRPARPLRVLCVDDEPLLRDVLRQILQSGGHIPSLAESGQAALALFQSALQSPEPFHAVITDLGMPHLDGREFAKAVKAQSPATPVILLTGWGKFMQEDGDAPAEVDRVLSKPPRVQEILEVLEKLTAANF